ncbi:MAG: AmmeMemoRadiSam system protein B [Prolixibacteraceae bacterium]|nr:AmmeMemoRadiSam system protein B [Prolixibacteraceae bacterium]
MQQRFSHKYLRKAQFAGQFYPDDKLELEVLLEHYFTEAKRFQNKGKHECQLRALIAPHAGYVFSGKVAALAYSNIPKNSTYKRVIVIASSHRYSFNGAAVYNIGNYETPLGKVKVDTEVADELLKASPLFIQRDEAHIYEHSIEVQLPFLQYKLGHDFSLVPIILGTHNQSACKEIATVLKKWFTTENLFVISTDFSHYPDYENAVRVDETTCNAICTNNPDNLIMVMDENKKANIRNLATSLCGWTSVLTLLYLTAGQNFSFIKNCYMNSGDSRLYSDKKRVVGYWAITVFDSNILLQIYDEEKKEILEKARTSIETFVRTGKRGDLIPPIFNGILYKKMGAFVSIYINGKLRGCIGGFAQEKTLNELIQKTAVSASCDKRFKPIGEDELENMQLEISVLSPLKKVKSVNEIELGKHGIYIRNEESSGTFLPQVATKTGWNIEEFLGHCSRDKAGLGWNGWKTADLFTYEAIIFSG